MSNFSFLDEPTTAGCPYCGQPMQLTAELAGQTVACPSCHAQIVIPANEPPRSATAVRRPSKDKHVVGSAMTGALIGAGAGFGGSAVLAGPDMVMRGHVFFIVVALLAVIAGTILGAIIGGGMAYTKN